MDDPTRTSSSTSSLTQAVGQLPATDVLCLLPQLQCMLGDLLAGHIGCHDEDGVLALDGLALPVGEAALRVSDGHWDGSEESNFGPRTKFGPQRHEANTRSLLELLLVQQITCNCSSHKSQNVQLLFWPVNQDRTIAE